MEREQKYASRLAEGVCRSYSPRACLRNGVLSVLGFFARLPQAPALRCILCHHVFDDQVEAFERIVTLLKGCGTFVDTNTCLDMVEGNRTIDRLYFHLSFDDGFKNVVVNAAPVLKRHAVPALFFVPTAYIGASYEKVSEYCLRVAGYRNPIEMCGWDDLKLAVDMGFEVGSHTRTHARFSDISGDAERLASELAGSKSDIEGNLGRPCATIAWPYGRVSDADEVSIRATKSVGYRACFGAFRGPVLDGGGNSFMIPRDHFETCWPFSHMRYFLARK